MARKPKAKKISPYIKMREKLVMDTIDNYERSHGLGKYASKVVNTTATPPEYPTQDEFNGPLERVSSLLNNGIFLTTKEEVRRDFEVGLISLRALSRAVRKALDI